MTLLAWNGGFLVDPEREVSAEDEELVAHAFAIEVVYVPEIPDEPLPEFAEALPVEASSVPPPPVEIELEFAELAALAEPPESELVPDPAFDELPPLHSPSSPDSAPKLEPPVRGDLRIPRVIGVGGKREDADGTIEGSREGSLVADPKPAATPEPAGPDSAPARPAATPRVVEHAQLDHAPNPVYPRRARELRQEGTVTLLALVKASGDVEACEVERSSGHPLLDEAGKKAVLGWRFKKRFVDGLAVPFTARVPLVFFIPRGGN